MPEYTHPTFVSVGAMLGLMRRKRYAPRAPHRGATQSAQLAEPIQQDGSGRAGPVYRWNKSRNGWTYLREQASPGS